MIKVERLNGTNYFINPHLIESMECLPDLTITMLSGKKIVVKNSPEDIIDKIVDYRKTIGCGVYRLPTGRSDANPPASTGWQTTPEE